MKIIIAGGGTGGHLFPGIAIAEAFMKRDTAADILFIGTERGIEKRVLAPLGYRLSLLDVEGIKNRGWMKALGAFLKIPGSMGQSYRILKAFSPHVVIGVGGYASGPAVLMARIMGIPTAVAEQNALPGVTNRILGRFVNRVFLSFPDKDHWFPAGKTLVTGNPVRESFREAVRKKVPEEKRDRFSLLIFGGSQGAHIINLAVMEALADLEVIKNSLMIIHQTGTNDYDQVAAAYAARGFTADVRPFITDMPAAYQQADLLICRAGATTVAEITATGKAAILIPFARAVHDHQTKNAEVLVSAGAAQMIVEADLNGKRLADVIRTLQANPETVAEIENMSLKLGNWGAAADIVEACIGLLH